MGQSSPGAQSQLENAPDISDPKRRLRRTEILLLLAPLPLAVMQLFGLWSKDAYKFFPFLLVAIIYLLIRRISRYGIAPDEHRTRIARFLIAVGLTLAAASILLASPWLATAATICMLGGVFSRIVGGTWRKHVQPIWWLLWLFLPPPFGFDRWLVHLYDETVRNAASAVLDLHGYVHWLAGDLLQTTDAAFVLNFVFTRYVSPMAVVAFSAVLAVRRRRSFLQAILLMLSAVWWLGLGEVLGIVAVPVLYRTSGIDLTSFWLSIAASGGVLALAVLLIHSTDVLFKPTAATAAALKAGASRFLKRLAWRFGQKKKRRPRVESRRGTGDAGARTEPENANRRKQQTDSRGTRRSRSMYRVSASPPIFARIAGVLGVACVCAQLGLVYRALTMASERPAATGHMAAAIKTAPRKLGTWERKADPVSSRSHAASELRHWQFTSDELTIETILSPLSGEIPEITASHSREGWNVYRRLAFPVWRWRRAPLMPQTEIDAFNSAGEAAWIGYGAVNSAGAVRSATGAAIRASWSETPVFWLLQHSGFRNPDAGPVYALQFQVFSDEPLSPRERGAVRKACRELIEVVRNRQGKE